MFQFAATKKSKTFNPFSSKPQNKPSIISRIQSMVKQWFESRPPTIVYSQQIINVPIDELDAQIIEQDYVVANESHQNNPTQRRRFLKFDDFLKEHAPPEPPAKKNNLLKKLQKKQKKAAFLEKRRKLNVPTKQLQLVLKKQFKQKDLGNLNELQESEIQERSESFDSLKNNSMIEVLPGDVKEKPKQSPKITMEKECQTSLENCTDNLKINTSIPRPPPQFDPSILAEANQKLKKIPSSIILKDEPEDSNFQSNDQNNSSEEPLQQGSCSSHKPMLGNVLLTDPSGSPSLLVNDSQKLEAQGKSNLQVNIPVEKKVVNEHYPSKPSLFALHEFQLSKGENQQGTQGLGLFGVPKQRIFGDFFKIADTQGKPSEQQKQIDERAFTISSNPPEPENQNALENQQAQQPKESIEAKPFKILKETPSERKEKPPGLFSNLFGNLEQDKQPDPSQQAQIPIQISFTQKKPDPTPSQGEALLKKPEFGFIIGNQVQPGRTPGNSDSQSNLSAHEKLSSDQQESGPNKDLKPSIFSLGNKTQDFAAVIKTQLFDNSINPNQALSDKVNQKEQDAQSVKVDQPTATQNQTAANSQNTPQASGKSLLPQTAGTIEPQPSQQFDTPQKESNQNPFLAQSPHLDKKDIENYFSQSQLSKDSLQKIFQQPIKATNAEQDALFKPKPNSMFGQATNQSSIFGFTTFQAQPQQQQAQFQNPPNQGQADVEMEFPSAPHDIMKQPSQFNLMPTLTGTSTFMMENMNGTQFNQLFGQQLNNLPSNQATGLFSSASIYGNFQQQPMLQNQVSSGLFADHSQSHNSSFQSQGKKRNQKTRIS